MSIVDRMRNAIAVLRVNISPTERMRAISALEGLTDEVEAIIKKEGEES